MRHNFTGVERSEPVPDREVHGRALSLPAANSRPRPPGAVEYLVQTLRAAPGEANLVTVAPFSNVAAALALALAPDLVDLVDAIVILRGAYHSGNMTPSSEFNILCDRQAAARLIDEHIAPTERQTGDQEGGAAPAPAAVCTALLVRLEVVKTGRVHAVETRGT